METRSQHLMFVGLLLGAFVLAALIFLPFLTAIILAIVLSVIFRPLHRWLSRVLAGGNEKNSWVALVTLLVIAIVVVTPLTFIAIRLYGETQHLYFSLTEESQREKIVDSLNGALSAVSNRVLGITPTFTFDSFNVTEYIQNFFSWSFANLDTVFSRVATVSINVFVMLLALFYLIRDGTSLRRNLVTFSPLPDSYEEQILNKLEQAIHSVVTGSLIISILQGFFTGIGFKIFGVPNPVLWGSVAMVAALIPGIGTSLVLVPGILYVYFTGNHYMALGLLLWGLLAVGLIDNILSSILMNRKVRIHPFLILLSVLGGFAFFGPIGFILGPLILAFLFALIEIYRKHRSGVLQ